MRGLHVVYLLFLVFEVRAALLELPISQVVVHSAGVVTLVASQGELH